MSYDPWSIKVDGFTSCKSDSERLAYLVRYAILAPSTHNSQPWRFVIGKNKIEIMPEMSRWLKEGDKDGRQMWMSIGCALENLLTASDFFGYQSEVSFDDNKNKILISLDRVLAGRFDENHLIFSIPKRVTTRATQTREILPSALVSAITDISSDYDDSKIFILDKDRDLAVCASATAEATAQAFSDRRFRNELSKSLKNNLTSSKVGMPMHGMGISTALSFVAPTVTRFINTGKIFAKKADNLIRNATGAVVIIGSEKDSPESWLNSGRLFEKSALIATRTGYTLAPLVASIEFNQRDTIKNAISQAPTNFKPQMLARLGRASDSVPHSPRLPLKSVCFLNTGSNNEKQ